MAKTVRPDMLGVALADLIDDITTESVVAFETAVKKVTIRSWGNIIKMTPVETGRARNNWTVGTSVGSSVKGSGLGSASMVAQQMPQSILGKSIYFYNNLPYITALEYGGYPKSPKRGSRSKAGGYRIKSIGGYSKQAPAGMVRVSLARWDRDVAAQFKREMANK